MFETKEMTSKIEENKLKTIETVESIILPLLKADVVISKRRKGDYRRNKFRISEDKPRIVIHEIKLPRDHSAYSFVPLQSTNMLSP